MNTIGKIIGSVLALVLALSALLFFLVTFWPGERIYLDCTGSAPWGAGDSQTASILFERLPAWVVWGESDGTVYLETPVTIYTFRDVRDRNLQLSFDGGPNGRGNGYVSKITSRVMVLFKDDGGAFVGVCMPSPDNGLR